jgi:hypothetical protein
MYLQEIPVISVIYGLSLQLLYGCWLILSVYIHMSFDFPFVRLFGVRNFGNFVITLIPYNHKKKVHILRSRSFWEQYLCSNEQYFLIFNLICTNKSKTFQYRCRKIVCLCTCSFFILSLHWKYTICILVNIIREINPISLCYK